MGVAQMPSSMMSRMATISRELAGAGPTPSARMTQGSFTKLATSITQNERAHDAC